MTRPITVPTEAEPTTIASTIIVAHTTDGKPRVLIGNGAPQPAALLSIDVAEQLGHNLLDLVESLRYSPGAFGDLPGNA
jgi:hypothetical protein